MKKVLLLLVALMIVASMSFGAKVVEIYFDGPVANDIATYTAGPGDVLGGFTGGTATPFSGGAATCAAPDIVAAPAGARQGGNALQCTPSDGPMGSGLCFQGTDILTGNSPFTVELLAMSSEWENVTTNEYGIVDIFHMFGDPSVNNLEIRELGAYGDFECVVHTGAAEEHIDAGAAPAVDTWVHYAATYDGTDVEFFIDGVSQGTAAPTWADYHLNDFGVGIWGNDASSVRSLNGYVDAVVISDAVLAPASFELSTTPVADWTIY